MKTVRELANFIEECMSGDEKLEDLGWIIPHPIFEIVEKLKKAHYKFLGDESIFLLASEYFDEGFVAQDMNLIIEAWLWNPKAAKYVIKEANFPKDVLCSIVPNKPEGKDVTFLAQLGNRISLDFEDFKELTLDTQTIIQHIIKNGWNFPNLLKLYEVSEKIDFDHYKYSKYVILTDIIGRALENFDMTQDISDDFVTEAQQRCRKGVK